MQPIRCRRGWILIGALSHWAGRGLWAPPFAHPGSGALFDGGRKWGCYHCLMDDEPQSEGGGVVPELGILGPVVGLVALQQSLLAIKYLLGAEISSGHLHVMDAWTGEHRQIALSVRPDCVLCQARH